MTATAAYLTDDCCASCGRRVKQRKTVTHNVVRSQKLRTRESSAHNHLLGPTHYSAYIALTRITDERMHTLTRTKTVGSDETTLLIRTTQKIHPLISFRRAGPKCYEFELHCTQETLPVSTIFSPAGVRIAADNLL